MIEPQLILDFIYKYAVVLINLLIFWLAFWILSSEAQKRIKKIFLLLSFSFFLWTNGAYLARLETTFFFSLTFWIRIAWVAGPLACLSLYFFIIYFIEEEKRTKFIDWFMILSTSLLGLSVAFTDFVIKGFTMERWGIDFIFGTGRIAYYAIFLIWFFIILWFAYQKYHRLPQARLKLQYFFLGIFILVGANTIFNIILPLLMGNTRYYQFGDYSCVFLLGFLAYSLQKYKLFEIKIILTQSLVGIISILLLFQALLAKESFDFLFRSGILMLFLIIGWFLVRSVKKEIQQKEKLEDLTNKLDGLNQMLEIRVKAKTESLQKKVEELEKFYKLTIGRELRMIELKQEIKKIKNKSKKEI